ncbi:MAG: hypothetical protein FRX49_08468 [Trebouxia sp. A1-2]|nr:MAG: hypothetical protein FRX49_08468 [Trebouxia sp. A1-2]
MEMNGLGVLDSTSYLNVVLIAPLRRESSFSPGVVHREQCNVVPHISPVEVLMRIVSKDSLVLGAVEDATAGTHHGRYGHYLLRALRRKAPRGVSKKQRAWVTPRLAFMKSRKPKGIQVFGTVWPRCNFPGIQQADCLSAPSDAKLNSQIAQWRRTENDKQAHMAEQSYQEPLEVAARRAPKAYNCSRARMRVSLGGGSMKSKFIRGSASSARSLVGGSLADGGDDEGLHAAPGVVAVLLHESRINDKLQQTEDVRACKGRVGIQHMKSENLPWHQAGQQPVTLASSDYERRLNNVQVGIDGRDHELPNLAAQPLRLQLQQLLCCLDLLLAGEEYEYVPWRLSGVYLEGRDHSCVQGYGKAMAAARNQACKTTTLSGLEPAESCDMNPRQKGFGNGSDWP